MLADPQVQAEAEAHRGPLERVRRGHLEVRGAVRADLFAVADLLDHDRTAVDLHLEPADAADRDASAFVMTFAMDQSNGPRTSSSREVMTPCAT